MRTLKSLDRFPKPRSVLMPKANKWRLCWDYNKDAKAIIQSTLTNVVPFCEQMGPRVWVGKQAEYPSPSWLENTTNKRQACAPSGIFHTTCNFVPEYLHHAHFFLCVCVCVCLIKIYLMQWRISTYLHRMWIQTILRMETIVEINYKD